MNVEIACRADGDAGFARSLARLLTLRLRSRMSRSLVIGAACAVILAGCGGADSDEAAGTSTPPKQPHDAISERLSLIGDMVEAWSTAESIEEAHIAAESAANLVVGPNGPGFGDRNGDGEIGGDAEIGLLPGLDGTPEGVALDMGSNPCVVQDVLGGSWEDPQAAWDEMLSAIEAWEPANNTMPALPSHPMRVVGWATFTLATDSLESAHEYAGHARLHVDVSMRALDC